MVRLLSIGIATVSIMIVLLPVMLILRYTVFRQSGTKKNILILLYALYLSAVFTAVGIPTINHLTVHAEIHFIPLVDSLNLTSFLNVILFVPLGFLLPTIWSDYRSFRRTLVMGLGFSLIIEILQIFTFRLTDIDDLITNTLGTILGYYSSKIFSERLRLKLPASPSKYEPLFVGFVVFLILFTVQPFLSDAMWSYILSSSLWEAIR